MKRKGSRRLIRGLGLALAVAAVAAPAAQAKPTPANLDNSGLSLGSRFYADDLHQAVPYVAIRQYADDRHSQSPISSAPVATAPRNYAPINTQARPDLYQPGNLVVSAGTTGFDWSDAGIGAVGALGLMLLGGGALLAVRPGRRGRLAAL